MLNHIFQKKNINYVLQDFAPFHFSSLGALLLIKIQPLSQMKDIFHALSKLHSIPGGIYSFHVLWALVFAI